MSFTVTENGVKLLKISTSTSITDSDCFGLAGLDKHYVISQIWRLLCEKIWEFVAEGGASDTAEIVTSFFSIDVWCCEIAYRYISPLFKNPPEG